MSQYIYPDRDNEFGQTILTLRSNIGLTQTSLANHLGVSRRAISDWEGGNKYPKPENLKQFITLALQNQVFVAGREVEEIRSLWRASHSKRLFDEKWLSEVFPPAKSKTVSDPPKTTGIIYEPGTSSASNTSSNQDWGEAPSIRNFTGRQQELTELASWLKKAGDCRVISILGLGGIGKTSISIKLGQQLAPQFDKILWCSLRNAPHCSEFLKATLHFLTGQPLSDLPTLPNEGISLLIKYLRRQRCLLILDNLETLLEGKVEAGSYREGFADYGMLIRRVAESEHQSCLVFTSQEKPRELGELEGFNSPIRSMWLGGLGQKEIRTILDDRGLQGNQEEWTNLTEQYDGNPLALKIISETIREGFGGSIKAFLATKTVVFGSFGYLLDTQFNRLTPLEKDLLCRLAVERNPVGLATLEGILQIQQGNRRNLLGAIESLRRRNFLERSKTGNEFTLQPVVMEYMTERLKSEFAGNNLSLSGLPV